MRGIELCMPKPYEGFTDNAELTKLARFLTAVDRAKAGMKTVKATAEWVICRMGFLLLISSLALAQGGVVNSTKNPLQVALMQWNKQDQPPTFAGSNPWGVAFDGANIWVTNASSNNVMKFRASDDTLLGTFAVGHEPVGAAFDGANIWVANFSGNNVTKLRASDGACVGTCTFAVGSFTIGV